MVTIPSFDCPHCGKREWKSDDRPLMLLTAPSGERHAPVDMTYCGSCGYAVLFFANPPKHPPH